MTEPFRPCDLERFDSEQLECVEEPELLAIGREVWEVVATGLNGLKLIKKTEFVITADNPFVKRFAGILNVAPEVVAQAFQRDAGLDVLLLKRANRAE